MKRFAGLILVFVMLLATLPALADETRTSGDFQYTLKSNGTATIVGYTGSGDIIIPQMLDGYTVTAIGDGAFFRQYKGSEKNRSVTLPDTIKSIGAFSFCNANITSINLPDGLEDIGKGAFVGCNSIAYRMSVNHPTFAVIEGALYNKSQKKLIWGKEGATIPEGIKIIGDYACYEVPNCGINKSGIVLPSTIEEIGDYAFYGNHYSFSVPLGGLPGTKYLKKADKFSDNITLIWGEHLRKIGRYAFQNVSLSDGGNTFNIPIPDSVTEIGEGCFWGFQGTNYRNQITITISKNSSLRAISAKALYNEDVFSYRCVIKCDAPIVKVGSYAFYRNEIQSINMQHVELIGEGAFMSAQLNFGISISASCKTISEDAFKDSRTDKNSITISNGVEVIESNAFAVHSNSIFPIRLPTSLTSIAPDAFRDDAEFIVERGSYAYRWADENARNYSIDGEKQNLDWLNN